MTRERERTPRRPRSEPRVIYRWSIVAAGAAAGAAAGVGVASSAIAIAGAPRRREVAA